MAWDINQIILVGRLTRDPELSYTSNQTPICKFSIANNRSSNNGQEDVSFFNIVTWNKLATNCSNYLKKGSQTIIEGRLKQNRYQDKSGQNKSQVEIVANNIQFLGSRSEGKTNTSTSTSTSTSNKDDIQFEQYPDTNINDDDGVPF